MSSLSWISRSFSRSVGLHNSSLFPQSSSLIGAFHSTSSALANVGSKIKKEDYDNLITVYKAARATAVSSDAPLASFLGYVSHRAVVEKARATSPLSNLMKNSHGSVDGLIRDTLYLRNSPIEEFKLSSSSSISSSISSSSSSALPSGPKKSPSSNLSITISPQEPPFDVPNLPAMYTHLALKRSLAFSNAKTELVSILLSEKDSELQKRFETKIALEKRKRLSKKIQNIQPQQDLLHAEQNLRDLKLDRVEEVCAPLEESSGTNDDQQVYDMSSVLKKRSKKMNHHKHRKRLKKDRVLRKKLGKI